MFRLIHLPSASLDSADSQQLNANVFIDPKKWQQQFSFQESFGEVTFFGADGSVQLEKLLVRVLPWDSMPCLIQIVGDAHVEGHAIMDMEYLEGGAWKHSTKVL